MEYDLHPCVSAVDRTYNCIVMRTFCFYKNIDLNKLIISIS